MRVYAIDPVQLALPPGGEAQEFRLARKGHPALVVEEVAELVTRLEGAGHPIRRDVQLDGYERAHVNDPFGNRIEPMERTA